MFFPTGMKTVAWPIAINLAERKTGGVGVLTRARGWAGARDRTGLVLGLG